MWTSLQNLKIVARNEKRKRAIKLLYPLRFILT